MYSKLGTLLQIKENNYINKKIVKNSGFIFIEIPNYFNHVGPGMTVFI